MYQESSRWEGITEMAFLQLLYKKIINAWILDFVGRVVAYVIGGIGAVLTAFGAVDRKSVV